MTSYIESIDLKENEINVKLNVVNHEKYDM